MWLSPEAAQEKEQSHAKNRFLVRILSFYENLIILYCIYSTLQRVKMFGYFIYILLVSGIDSWFSLLFSTIAFGPPGNSKSAILFFMINVVCWGYPMYVIKVSSMIIHLNYQGMLNDLKLYSLDEVDKGNMFSLKSIVIKCGTRMLR